MPNPDRYLLESSATDGYLLEDGTGVLLLEVSPCYSALVLSDNPIAYWRMDTTSGTTVRDYSTNANNGVLAGTYTLNVIGALTADSNPAVTFSTPGGRSEASAIAAYNVGDVFSLECWVKRTRTAVAIGEVMVVQNGFDSWALLFGANDTLNVTQGGEAGVYSSTTTITDTNWHHVVTTKDGPYAFFYIDGVDAGPLIINPPFPIFNNAFSGIIEIGSGAAGTDEWLFGSIDEVAIYNYALNPSQVVAHYAARLTNCQFLPYVNPMPPFVAQ